MSKLVWDAIGERKYEIGVDRGVVFPMLNKQYQKGAAWNGLTAVNESPSGAEVTKLWANNAQYGSVTSAEEFGATIEAYTYPDEFAACDGSLNPVNGVRVNQQVRRPFGFTYRNMIGNDTDDMDFGYKIHLVYGGRVTPSEKSRATVNDSPDVGTFSWTLTTTPVTINAINPDTGKAYKPSAHLEIDSTQVDATKLAALEDILYGTENTDSRLPMPDEVIELFAEDGNPLTGLKIDVNIPATMDLFGKNVSDLQSNVVVGDNAITGTLNYITNYTGFSSKVAEQSGNYLALHADVPGVDDATITVKVTNPSVLDSDRVIVLKIADKDTQTVTVTASKDGYTPVSKVFGLTGLVCEAG